MGIKINPIHYLVVSILLLIALASKLMGSGTDEPQHTIAEGLDTITYIRRAVYAQGDDKDWANRHFDDKKWSDVASMGLPSEQTLYWIRNYVDISNSNAELPLDHAVAVGILGSFELYWDGEYIGHNGVVGTSRESETPGYIQQVYRIPRSLYRPGEHTISLRVSSFHSQKGLRQRHYHIFIGSNEAFLKRPYKDNLLPLIMLGGILVVGLYYLLMYTLYESRLPVLLFSLLCCSMSLLIFTESYRDLFNYLYPWHWYRMVLVLLLSATTGILLTFFCLSRFNMGKKRLGLGVTSLVMLASVLFVDSFDLRAYYIFAAALSASIVVVIIALRAKKSGARLTLLGLAVIAVMMLGFPEQFMDNYLFVSFGVLSMFTLASLTLKLREQHNEHQAAQLNSFRLEIELLKKNIQPHFVLNTLTAIEEWIEESPPTAIEFINTLADEFRIMNTMAHKKLVSLEQELSLCDSHLKLMGFRQDLEFKLIRDVNIDTETLVPPAIFHTLLENAISHNHYRSGYVEFQISQRQSGQIDSHKLKYRHNPITTMTYCFKAPKAAMDSFTPKNTINTGTGLRYIKARLEESFTGQWNYSETETEDSWVTTLSFPSTTRPT